MPHKDELPEILPPREDGVFKSTFSREDSKPALLELLSDIICRPLKDVIVLPNELPINDINTKREVFDIHCTARDNQSQLAIEMQATPMKGDTRENEHRNIRNRSVYNLSHLHSGQSGRGVNYANLNSSYQITLCNYNVFNWDNELAERFTYRNESGRQLSDITTAIFVDLTQADRIIVKSVSEMSAIEQWVVFLAKVDDPKYQNVLTEILKRKEGISVAYEMLNSISMDENERARFRARRIWQMDREHDMAQAKYEGREEARIEYEQKLSDKDAIIAELRAQLDGRNS